MEVVPVEMGPENTEDVKKRGNSPFFYLLCKKKTIQMLKKIPHTFVIIGFIILICGVLTWFIPAGEYNYETVSINGIDRSVVIDGSFHKVESSPQTWQIFSSLLSGFQRQSGIIAFILIIGGAFQIMNSSRAIDFGILSFLKSSENFEKNRLIKRIGVNNIVISVIMLIFSLFGAVFGMSEETLAFIIIFVPLAISMGYDSITGVLMVYVAAHVGFSGAIINPFTIGIAQGLSGLQLFSGIEYRIFVWIILTIIVITFTLIYANRIKKNPLKSPMYKSDQYWRERGKENEGEKFNTGTPLSAWIIFLLTSIAILLWSVNYPYTTIVLGNSDITFICLPVLSLAFIISGFLTLRKSYLYFILNILGFTIVFLIIGVLGYGWYIKEISALFLVMGIVSGISTGLKSSASPKYCDHFLAGIIPSLLCFLLLLYHSR